MCGILRTLTGSAESDSIDGDALRLGSHPFSHDLLSLRRRVEECGFQLPACAFRLKELSEYAGDARYAEPIVVEEETRAVLRECIAMLREFVVAQAGLR